MMRKYYRKMFFINVNCYIVTDNDNAILIDTGRKKYREKILEK